MSTVVPFHKKFEPPVPPKVSLQQQSDMLDALIEILVQASQNADISITKETVSVRCKDDASAIELASSLMELCNYHDKFVKNKSRY